MAAIDQINVNIGTEQSPNYVLHDVNDKRISSTAVTTATHLLATDASLSAINPITAANLASVLGAVESLFNTNWTALENVPVGRYFFTTSNKPSFLDSSFADYGLLEIYGGLTSDNRIAKIAKLTTVGTGSGIYQNVLYTGVDRYRGWTRIDNFGCNTAAELASLLGGCISRGYIDDCFSLAEPGIYTLTADTQNAPFRYGVVIAITSTGGAENQIKIAFNASSGHTVGILYGNETWSFFDKVS